MSLRAARAGVGQPSAGAGRARGPSGPLPGALSLAPCPRVVLPRITLGAKTDPLHLTRGERELSGRRDDNCKFEDLEKSWALSPRDSDGVVRPTDCTAGRELVAFTSTTSLTSRLTL